MLFGIKFHIYKWINKWYTGFVFGVIMGFAIIRTGGKQYKVSPGDRLYVEKIEADVGSRVRFDDVLLHSDKTGDDLFLEGTVIKQMRSRKVIIFKKKRRNNYRRKNGHRQHLTVVQFDAV